MATLLGICGGSGAGKTTLAVELTRLLGPDRVSALAFDSYYRDLSHLTMQERMRVNYDHPDSLDNELFAEHLADLRAGRDIEVPDYDFATHTRTGTTTHVEAKEIVLVEGILLFCFPGIHDLLDFAVFIDVSEDIRIERRVARDVAERGRDADDVRRQFAEFVAPMHDQFVQPYLSDADLVVSGEGEARSDAVAIVGRMAALDLLGDRPATDSLSGMADPGMARRE